MENSFQRGTHGAMDREIARMERDRVEEDFVSQVIDVLSEEVQIGDEILDLQNGAVGRLW